MKTKWLDRTKRALWPLLVLALTAGVIATPTLDAARAVDLNESCSLAVTPGGPELAEDLAKANVVYDLYKVANAIPDEAYDTYSYESASLYSGLDFNAAASGSDEDDLSNAAWRTLAQEAAEIALNGGDSPIASDISDTVEGLSSGLYLVIARGSNVKDYVTTVTDDAGTESLATAAHSDVYNYTFLPELVSLPSRGVGDTVGTAADLGDWNYAMAITLKPGQSLRFGSLEIVKNLSSYEASHPATFVFEVEGTLDGEVVFSDVASLSFHAAGQQTALVERIPVGAKVTVREVYSGAAYTLESAEAQTADILADTVAQVTFTNAYNGSGNQGGAITNHFDYSEEGGWSLTPIRDGAE